MKIELSLYKFHTNKHALLKALYTLSGCLNVVLYWYWFRIG